MSDDKTLVDLFTLVQVFKVSVDGYLEVILGETLYIPAPEELVETLADNMNRSWEMIERMMPEDVRIDFDGEAA